MARLNSAMVVRLSNNTEWKMEPDKKEISFETSVRSISGH